MATEAILIRNQVNLSSNTFNRRVTSLGISQIIPRASLGISPIIPRASHFVVNPRNAKAEVSKELVKEEEAVNPEVPVTKLPLNLEQNNDAVGGLLQ